MEGAVLAGKLAAEIVVDDALGEVQPSATYVPKTIPSPQLYINPPKLYPTRRGTALSYICPKLYPHTTSCSSNPDPAPDPDAGRTIVLSLGRRQHQAYTAGCDSEGGKYRSG